MGWVKVVIVSGTERGRMSGILNNGQKGERETMADITISCKLGNFDHEIKNGKELGLDNLGLSGEKQNKRANKQAGVLS